MDDSTFTEEISCPSGAESRFERGDDPQSAPTDPDVAGEMDNEHRERLRKIGDYIKERLTVGHILGTLRDEGIVNDRDEERIMAPGNDNKQSTSVLLEILPERGPRAFDAFYDSLLMCEAADYSDLVTKLDSVEVGGLGGAGSQQKDRIQVVIRVRPPQNVEGGQGGVCLTVDAQEMKVSIPGKQFYFDKVFPEETTQAELFDTMASPIVDSVLEGYNGCILCYGRTGSGKTYTMEGPPGRASDDETKGIIYRTLEQMFLRSEGKKDWNISFSVSVLEVYNERVFHLTKPQGNRASLGNISPHKVASAMDAFNVFKGASEIRQSRDTFANKRSSRSHMIFQVVVSILHKEGTESGRTGELYLVDLAGSEAAGEVNTTAEGLREGANINLSLMYLQQVIGDLSVNNVNQQNFKFRRSKLTMLLKPVLTGNSMTTFIVNVDPVMTSLSDTEKSLKFASDAKKVKVKPSINYIPLQSLINKYLKLIAELKAQVQTLRNNSERRGARRSPRMTSDVGTDAFVEVNPATFVGNADVNAAPLTQQSQSFDPDSVHDLVRSSVALGFSDRADEFRARLDGLKEEFKDDIATQMEGFQARQQEGIQLLEDFRSQLKMLAGMHEDTPGPIDDREQQINIALNDLRSFFLESIDGMVSQLARVRPTMEENSNDTIDECVPCCECCKVCCRSLWYWQPGHKWYSLRGKGAGWVVLLLFMYLFAFLIILLYMYLEIRQKSKVNPEDDATRSNTNNVNCFTRFNCCGHANCCNQCTCTCPTAPIYVRADDALKIYAHETPGRRDAM